MKQPARLVTAGAALMIALVLAVAPLATGRSVEGWQAVAGVVGLIALTAGLAGWWPGIGWSAVGLATVYTLGVGGRVGADPTAPLAAAGLVLVAELAVWSLEARSLAPDRDDVIAWRLRRLALIEAATLIGGTIVVAASNMPARGGEALGAIGVISAVAVFVLAALGLRWSSRR